MRGGRPNRGSPPTLPASGRFLFPNSSGPTPRLALRVGARNLHLRHILTCLGKVGKGVGARNWWSMLRVSPPFCPPFCQGGGSITGVEMEIWLSKFLSVFVYPLGLGLGMLVLDGGVAFAVSHCGAGAPVGAVGLKELRGWGPLNRGRSA